MKIRVFFTAAVLFLSVAMANAQGYLQDPKYGPDEESRKENVKVLNFFQEAYKMKAYDEAATHLAQLLKNCPGCSQNLYIYGANIYKNKIAKATDEAKRDVYVDSLMTIYDLRIANFGDNAKRGTAYILGVQAQDLNEFRPERREQLAGLLRKAIDEGMEKTDPVVISLSFKIMTEDFQAGNYEADNLISEYDRFMGLLDKSEAEEAAVAKQNLEGMFMQSGVASCENIEKIFKPQYEATPNNAELIKKILGMLQRGGCNSEFQITLVERLYEMEPTPAAALQLAGVFEDRKDHAKALSYMEVAIAGETDATNKANHLIRAAGASLSSGNNRAAADYARRAIEANPENGYGYFFLAQAYAAGTSSACGDFDRQAAFWLVSDTLSKARTLLANDATQVENINKQINTYSAYFPKTEECFFRDLSNGDGYTVNCGWISGRTTVRGR